MLRAISVRRAGAAGSEPVDVVVLAQDERHVRRKTITLGGGGKVLVDLPEPVVLGDGDILVLDDGRHIGIVAAEEELYDIRGRDPVHLAELVWHIGNRHLAAAIEPGRILILRDHVIKAMLEGLGATVTEISEPFEPLRGAYSGHAHGAVHAHEDPEPDHGYGRSARSRGRAQSDGDNDREPDHGHGRSAAQRIAGSGQTAEVPEPDHGYGRSARSRGATQAHSHGGDDQEPDHGAGRAARRRSGGSKQSDAVGQPEPDHGRSRRGTGADPQRGVGGDEEPDHGSGRGAGKR